MATKKPNRRGKPAYIYFAPELDVRMRAECAARLLTVTRLVEYAVEQLLDRLALQSAPGLGLGFDSAARAVGAGAAERELAAGAATHDDEAGALESLALPFAAASSSLVSSPAASSRSAAPVPPASRMTRRRRG